MLIMKSTFSPLTVTVKGSFAIAALNCSPIEPARDLADPHGVLALTSQDPKEGLAFVERV
jgi:hypothetical protein